MDHLNIGYFGPVFYPGNVDGFQIPGSFQNGYSDIFRFGCELLMSPASVVPVPTAHTDMSILVVVVQGTKFLQHPCIPLYRLRLPESGENPE